MPFADIKKSDLIPVDHEGSVVDGGKNRPLNIVAFMIDSAIREARPEVLRTAHSHSIYGRSFSTLDREIDISIQDSCGFYNRELPHLVCDNLRDNLRQPCLSLPPQIVTTSMFRPTYLTPTYLFLYPISKANPIPPFTKIT